MTQHGLADDYEAFLCRRFALQEGARRLAGSKALDGCFRRRQFGQDAIEAVYYPDRDTAGLRHIQTCGSRWACPVCAAILSQLSCRELKAAIDAHEASGGGVVMATLTVPHYARQGCAQVLGSQQKWLACPKGTPKDQRIPNPLYGGLKEALHLFSGCRQGKALYQQIGIVGTVRNLEVNHGDNGFHCHSHSVWFTEKPLEGKALEQAWLLGRNRWLDSVEKSGLPVLSRRALKKHGFRLTTDKQFISDYVTKLGKDTEWHLEHEMAKQAVKLGKLGGRTPMQLLADYTYDGDEAAGVLWAEYAATYRGSKQLYWSKGLRLRTLGADREYTDDELMNIQATGELPEWAKPPAHELVIAPTDREWSAICADGVRGTFLGLVRRAGRTKDKTELEKFFAPHRVLDRSLAPLVRQTEKLRLDVLQVSDRDDAPELGEGQRETTVPKFVQQELFGGAYVNPLTRDNDVLAMWPSLTSDQADRYQLMHSAYQEGDPFADRVPQLEYLAETRHQERERLAGAIAAETVRLPGWLYKAVLELSAWPSLLDAALTPAERALLHEWKQSHKLGTAEKPPLQASLELAEV